MSRSIRNTTAVVVLIGFGTLLLLSGCAGAPGPNNVADLATGHSSGFWAGLWHGLILPITFVVSLFTDKVNIYDVHNNGGWYNFGFLIGVLMFGGGGGRGASGHRKRRKDRD